MESSAPRAWQRRFQTAGNSMGDFQMETGDNMSLRSQEETGPCVATTQEPAPSLWCSGLQVLPSTPPPLKPSCPHPREGHGYKHRATLLGRRRN